MTYEGGPIDVTGAAESAGPGSEAAAEASSGVTFGSLAGHILALPARLGTVRLVVVDGPSGSGKTSFAKRLAWAMHRVPVVHLDHLYDGWSGLGSVGCALDSWVLTPLRNSLPGRHLVYDWRRGAYTEWREVPLAPALVVEGVGASQRRFDPWTSLRVWVDCDTALRHERALRREGEDHLAQLEQWWQEEQDHFESDQTEKRADLVVDGSHKVGTALTSPVKVLADRLTPTLSTG